MTTTYPDDVDAAWTIKAKKPYYGYKIHAATDGDHGFILGGHATPANHSGTKELAQVIEEIYPEEESMILADKGYASAANRETLEDAGHTDGIRYKVERAFGALKRDYGFGRARRLGCAKVKSQFLLCATTAFNLKKAARMVG